MLACLIATPAPAAGIAGKVKLAVLDIELTGDLAGPQLMAEHETRLRKESDSLRKQLSESGLYTVVDLAPAEPLLAKLKSQQKYLHDCDGCDLEVGHQLGADQVMGSWVDRGQH